MPAMPVNPDHARAAAVDRLLRQAVLVAARDPFDVDAYGEAAQTARALDRIDTARVFEALATLHAGSGPTVAPAGLPPTMLARARDELAALLAIPAAPDGGAHPASPDPSPDAAQLCVALAAALRAPDATDRFARLLAEAAALAASRPPIDLRDHVDAEAGALLELLALRALQAFVAVNRDLAGPPHGSPRLLHAMARLGPAGLGPYGRNLPNLLRSGRDFLGLLGLVVGPDSDTETLVARWAVLFAGHARGTVLVDALRPLGMTGPLGPMLDAVGRRIPWRGDREREVIWRIRDAALDAGDLPLAVRAQRLSLQARPRDFVGWRVLGEVLVAAGELDAAEAALRNGLAIAPDDAFTARRLQALRAGHLGFAPTCGYDRPRASEGERAIPIAA